MGHASKFRRLGRKCFYCKGKENISTAIDQGGIYQSTNYYHYHPHCVRDILNHPEEHPEYVDTAIVIMDRINEHLEKVRASGERRLRGLERAWGTLRTLDNMMGSIDGNNRTGSPETNFTQKESQHV